MDIQSARYYMSVYDCRSLSKAAKEHYVTQPVISRSITALEDEFGCTFFERSKHGVVPTEAGTAFYQYAQKYSVFYQEIAAGMSAFSGKDNLSLSIAGITPPVKEILPKAVSEFNRMFPEIRINIERFVASEIIPLIQEDSYDFYITMMSDIRTFPRLKSRLLLSERFHLITKEEMQPKNDREAIRLMKENPIYVLPEQDAPFFYRMAVDYLKEAGIGHPDLKTARPIESLSYNVSANLGVALSPARHEFNEPGLSAYVIKGSPHVELGIAWKKETLPSKTFISILEKLINEKE
ncbi:MAG: LysR family transcriptional regulator [Lachnospiraceae bacterium]|nr:LysR family transcriptional regulator [Lachnospiraceae bacterium]